MAPIPEPAALLAPGAALAPSGLNGSAGDIYAVLYGGLGNQIYALLSVSALALETGRRLHVKFNESTGGLAKALQRPLPFATDVDTFLSDAMAGLAAIDMLNCLPSMSPSITRDLGALACERGTLGENVVVLADGNLLSLLWPTLRRLQQRVRTAQLLPSLARSYMRLRPDILSFARTVQRGFAARSRVIGVHARTRMYDWEEGQVPDYAVEDYFACVDALGAANATVFVASPSRAVKDLALARYGTRAAFLPADLPLRYDAAGAAEAAIADLLLLAHADALVLTPGSTFGEVAAALGRVREVYDVPGDRFHTHLPPVPGPLCGRRSFLPPPAGLAQWRHLMTEWTDQAAEVCALDRTCTEMVGVC